MCNTPIDAYVHLPSPPLSPFRNCDNLLDICSELENQTKELKYENVIGSPIEYTITLEKSQDEILRNKFLNNMDEGVKVNDEMVPYPYFIQKLHSIGNSVINKKTKDAVPLRVYETGKDIYQEFWVHPMFLSLQSYQFFKLFEEVKKNNEQGVIEIEVPSLRAFPIVLYWIYTGDLTKLLELAKLDESLCKGIMENIECLEIQMNETF
ncbi:hypothetical protein BCR32DRAFT_328254 [Anaeromyces robustus]|uniref:BTB domain-containing protein n=1 Tax=Anaeromyces robustus TaxID=1754192 RepID=A0A1Y1WZW1_9FUNG|nr:hypothetical protein BCR32DRAFT_328254 [Anaeromyces robustus]|eukprot:ORX79119.1 hypothetical protein BCR32DRAFT_328254 [Anaeromyces robustus]